MKKDNIDFHIELAKAFLEPGQAKFDYLESLRKQSKYSKDGFLDKLLHSYSNIYSAWKEEESFALINYPGIYDFKFPISALLKYPVLNGFARSFSGHISESLLVDLKKFLSTYETLIRFKRVKKTFQKLGKESIENSFAETNNTFNSMPIEEVREHFRPLTEKKNRISGGEIWMAKEDFEIFLRRSFGGEKKLPKPKINIGPRGKYAIVKLFHSFYKKTLDHPYNGPREKDPVFNLLKDAFKTSIFDNERKDNFKSDKSKYQWS